MMYRLAQSAAGVPDLRRRYWRAQRAWSESYFADTFGGVPLRQYIE
jgi:REP element-mobilizing transposase RayT